jgi:hypothetical protein
LGNDIKTVDAEESEDESGSEAKDTDSDEKGFLESILGSQPGLE